MKNKSCKIFVTGLFMLAFINSQAQLSKVESTFSAAKLNTLHVGDHVPDRDFKVSNSLEKQINLARLQGNWILLDLWGIYCGTCIEHMPDVAELQRKYRDKLKVIMVSRNTDQQVQKLAKFAYNVRNNKLPFINGPDQLSGLFDFSFVPQYIWINPEGVIRYMTNEQFSGDTVRNILDGRNYQVTEKKTVLFAHTDVSIITNLYPLFGDNFYTYSYLAPHDDRNYDYNISFHSSLGFNGLPKTESGFFSFKQLYQAAYGFSMQSNPLPDERVVINFDDTAELAKEEELLFSVEDKWIRGQIAKDTYERWYKVYTTNINNMKSFIERIGKSQDHVFDLLKRNFDLLTDMRYVYSEADTLDKREFVRQVFDSNLYYKNGIYRTPTMLSMFARKSLIMKQKELLIFEKKRDDDDIIPLSGERGICNPYECIDNQCLMSDVPVYAPNYAPLSCYRLIANLMI